MSTTWLKLPDELKQRAVAAAAKIGVSPHAFMVHAILAKLTYSGRALADLEGLNDFLIEADP